MNVLDHQQEAPLGCGDRQERNDRLEEAQLRLSGVVRRVGATGAELREELRELRAGGPEALRERLGVLSGQVVADRLHERQVRQGELRLAADPAQHDGPEAPGLICELIREPRLPDAGLAREDDHPALPPPGFEEVVLERGKLLVPPHEDGAPFD